MSLSAFLDHVVGQPPSHVRKRHYHFGKTLGAGAFGVVRMAHNRDTQEDVAIKVILKSKLREPSDAQAVTNEFEILQSLDHPHIVQLREWFESKDKLYMVTQLCTGGELFDRIIDHGSFTERDAARVIREVSSALQYLHHRNIVHRDVKPENLLYEDESPDGSSPLVLCDFGVAKSLMSEEQLITSAAGSLGYAAPEVFDSRGHSKPADVWSLGVVLYTILSGVSPFQAETPEDFMSEVQPGYKPYFYPKYWGQVSTEAKKLVSRMLDYDPETRITIDEVAAHPWVSGADANSVVDLLPVVRPKLEARKHWRAAYEQVRLAKQLHRLQIDDSDDEDTHGHARGHAQSASQDDAGARFMQVVAAASARARAEEAARQKSGGAASDAAGENHF